MYAGEGGNYNIVNNHYKPGPSTKQAVRTRLLNPYKLEKGANPLPYGKFYFSGNYQDASADITCHNWRGVDMNSGTRADTALAQTRTPFNLGLIATQSAAEAYPLVLAQAGATRPQRDSLDQQLVREAHRRAGRLRPRHALRNIAKGLAPAQARPSPPRHRPRRPARRLGDRPPAQPQKRRRPRQTGRRWPPYAGSVFG